MLVDASDADCCIGTCIGICIRICIGVCIGGRIVSDRQLTALMVPVVERSDGVRRVRHEVAVQWTRVHCSAG